MDWVKKAAKRVEKSPRLREHAATINYDWREEGESHEKWVATAPIAEIVSWAETVEDADGDPAVCTW